MLEAKIIVEVDLSWEDLELDWKELGYMNLLYHNVMQQFWAGILEYEVTENTSLPYGEEIPLIIPNIGLDNKTFIETVNQLEIKIDVDVDNDLVVCNKIFNDDNAILTCLYTKQNNKDNKQKDRG